MRRLPPLETLRVFEAAARLKSFKAAAAELNVTASAVSHRVAALEEDLGAQLFIRHTRRLELTLEGERLANGTQRAMNEFRRAISSVDRRSEARLRITAIPSHVTRWLAPRLHRFQAANPDIDLDISADIAVIDMTQRSVDVACRFGAGDYPGFAVERLMGDAVVLVASPRYLEVNGPVERPADALRLARIYDTTAETDDSEVNWRAWLTRHRLPVGSDARGLQFNGAVLTLEAAAGGLGLAITRRSLVAEDLRNGRLAKVLRDEHATHWSHYAVTHPDMCDWPPVKAFVSWLKSEAEVGRSED